MTEEHTSSLWGSAAILTSSMLYGTYGLWSRLMGSTFPPFFQAWVRSLIIIVLMAPAAFDGWRLRKLDREDWPQIGIYLSFCVFTQVPIYYAFNNAPVGAVQLIFYAVFIITAYIVARFYLGERLTPVKLAAMLMTIAGMGLVFGGGLTSIAPAGLLLATVGGVASGAEMSATKQVSEKYSAAYLVLLGWVATFVTHLPASLLVGERQLPPHLDRAWLWLLLYTAANAVAFWLSVAGFKRVDASIGSLLGVTEAVFAVLIAAAILRQTPSWSTVVGGIVIVAAAVTPDLWVLRRVRCRPGGAMLRPGPSVEPAQASAIDSRHVR